MVEAIWFIALMGLIVFALYIGLVHAYGDSNGVKPKIVNELDPVKYYKPMCLQGYSVVVFGDSSALYLYDKNQKLIPCNVPVTEGAR